MEFFKKLSDKHKKLLKAGGVAVVIIIVLAAVTGYDRPFIHRGVDTVGFGFPSGNVAFDYDGGMMKGESVARMEMSAAPAMFSIRNAMPIAPSYGGTTGNDAEAFEVTDYSASIESGDIEEDCAVISNLKARDYVIFEHSNSHDRGCGFTFKVVKANVPEVLSAIEKLDPKELSISTETIKNQVSDFTSQTDILKKKLASIDETLRGAMAAYADVTELATRSGDANALAKVISSKVEIIERLTQERININTQLDYLARAKADQLDRLEYSHFNVNVYENNFVDGRNLKDSWKEAIRNFIWNINGILQGLTVGLVALFLCAVQYIIYIVIAIAILKYLWKFIKGFWKR